MTIYLLPGLGADRRLFARMAFGDAVLHFLDWPKMPAGSTIADFARAMCTQVDANEGHVLLGVSMGGMVAQEMAALTGAQRVVILSSWKVPEEMPGWIRMLRGTHPERMLTAAMLKAGLPMARWQMGVESPEDIALFNDLIHLHGVDQLKRQIAACLGWEGPGRPVADLTHIHGDRDRLMPIDRIKGAVVIEGGSHFMVLSKADEVSAAVRTALYRS